MTSTASQLSPNPAPIPSAASTAASYASAAGATKKPTSTPPVIASGTSHPPMVVGSSVPAAPQHAKTPSTSNMNGRPTITPAVPTVSTAPAVAHGTSNVNGISADHSRKSSVTISANGPHNYMANGGSGGPSKAPLPQFGFPEGSSPAPSHSTLQPTSSAPIAIPGGPAINQRIPSPATSPSPIPQPSASGGKPGATDNTFKIGSFTGAGDLDRGSRPPSMSQQSLGLNSQPAHLRRDSAHSQHSDMGNHGGQGPGGRVNYPQGGRGGRGYNQSFNGPVGYPPPNGNTYPPRGPAHGQGRGGMPPQNYGSRGGMQPTYSPQPHRGSPAMPPAMPNQGTPTMNPAMPIPPPPHGYSHQYPPPLSGYPPTYPYQYDAIGRPMGMGLPNYPQLHQPIYQSPGSPAPGGFPHPFGAQYPPAQTQPMSRNSSQISERPASSTGQNQGPAVSSSASQPLNSQAKGGPNASSTQFVKPSRKSAAIVIKNAQGETVDLTTIKAPASPAPSIQQSRTPPAPAMASSTTPTPPPPKATTPSSHARSESASTAKNADQVRNEFMERVKKSAETSVEGKPNEDEEKVKAAAEKAAAEKAAAEKAAAEKAAAEKAAAEERAKEEERLKEEARVKAEQQKAVEEAKAAEEARKAKEAAEKEAAAVAKAKSEAAEAAKKQEKPAEVANPEEDELERMIREMEEADAKREAEQAELTSKKNAEKDAAKKKAEEDRASHAAENDRKLKEQEREMERLEEEREKARAQKEATGETKSVTELLGKISDLTSSQKEGASATPNSVADKLSKLTINSKDASGPTSGPSSAKSTGKERSKPAALNLAPLNTKTVEPPQPSAALQSLKSARFLTVQDDIKYPNGIASPNPALNAAVTKKGKAFKYDSAFLLQFQKVFTEEPSVEFHQQVKALIGDSDGSRSASRTTGGAGSGRQGSHRNVGTTFPGGMGGNAFGSFSSNPAPRTLPPGTTSDQRFSMSQQMNRPMSVGPFRPGAFPGGNPMTRNPSSSNMGMPNSPRQGSRRGGNNSRRAAHNAQAEAQAARTMPLTQGMEIKPLAPSATGWKPASIVKGAQGSQGGSSGHMEPDVVQRKVKAALNKMTPEKFDKIADQILEIAGQSKDEQDGRTLRQVIQLTFEKATDESHWAEMYAKFCRKMHDNISPDVKDVTLIDKNGHVVNGGNLFRKYLLNRCQEEFERGWKVDLPKPKEGESKEAALMSDEYYVAAAAKRRGLGLVQFIGELFKLGMLTERIMHQCVQKLLDFKDSPDEQEIESLSKLLHTIGANLDESEKSRSIMDAYFQRITGVINMPELNSRLKFMLMDVVDLRSARWHSKDDAKGPKTLDEIRADAEADAARKAAESARSNQRNQPGGRGSHMGRGDGRTFSNYHQAAPNTVGMDDLRRLKGSASSRSMSGNITLGPTAMFASRSSSGRRLGPGGSLSRGGEDSGTSSRTGTPPTRESSTNAFAALANMESEHPQSPPSTAASPALAKAVPDSTAGGKKGTD